MKEESINADIISAWSTSRSLKSGKPKSRAYCGYFRGISGSKIDRSGGVAMNELTKRALEVHDALRECAEADIHTCIQCAYYDRGCHTTLMLDAAKVIGRLIEEVDNG